jgi:hypothetical protein
MIITFEIKQNLSEIIKDCKTSKYWFYQEASKKGRFNLQDKEFDNSYASCYQYDNRLSIITAWGNYSYLIEQRQHGTFCTYNGPLKGFLQQSLLPGLTPKGNIYERLVYSTKEGWLKFRELLDKRNWNLYFEIE